MIILSTPTSGKPTRLVVECKSDITPRVTADAARQLDAYLSRVPDAVGVVVAPWGSRRTREVLKDSGIGFIDPTGNIELVVGEPGLVIRATMEWMLATRTDGERRASTSWSIQWVFDDRTNGPWSDSVPSSAIGRLDDMFGGPRIVGTQMAGGFGHRRLRFGYISTRRASSGS